MIDISLKEKEEWNINKKICIVLSLIFLLLLFTAAVSASDNETVIEKSDDAAINHIEINENSNVKSNDWNLTADEIQSTESEDILKSNENESLLTANKPIQGYSFSNIRDALNQAEDGDVFFLNGVTYSSDGNEIIITKKVTIYGRSENPNDNRMATLDAQGYSGIFHIQSSDVTLIGINFKNGNGKYHLLNNGGAIYWDAKDSQNQPIRNCTVIGCTFTGNTADNGGALYWESHDNPDPRFRNCNVFDCTFTGNTAKQNGIIFLMNVNGVVDNCTFIDNNVNEGGSVFWFGGQNSYLKNCNFNDDYIHSDRIIYGDGIIKSGNIIYLNNARLATAIIDAGVGGTIILKRKPINCLSIESPIFYMWLFIFGFRIRF